MTQATRDPNFIPALLVEDASGNSLPVTGATVGSVNVIDVAIRDGSGNQITSFGGSGGTAQVDDSAFTAGSGQGTPAMGFFSTDTVDSDDVGVLAMDASRRLLVSIEADNAGIGGGTQYSIGTAAGATDTGTAALAIRDDSLSTLSDAEGDWVGLRVNSTGALHVTGGGGGTEYTEDSVTPATITGTATLMERDDALSSVTPIEGDWIGLRGTAEGALWVQDFNSDAILADTANIDTNVATLAGAVSGTEMQVDVLTSALPTGAATAANQSTANTSLSNIEAGYAAEGSALGSGVLLQGDDGTDRKNINVDATTGDVQVDVTNTVTVDGSGVTQPVSGTVTANLSTTDNTVLDNIDSNTDYGAVTGGGTEAGALRVTIANNSTGVVSIDDNGSSITVDGTVTANLSATDNAVLDNIDSDTSNIQTAVELIDDAIFTDDTSTHTAATTKVMGVGAVATPTDTTVDANDIAMPGMSTDRRMWTDTQIVGQDADLTIADGGNSITVDGTVTANLSATDNAVLDQIEVNTSYGDNTGGGTEAGALRVTVANNSTGVLSVDDNGGSLTVDSSDLTTLAGAVSGSEMQVDIVAPLPAGTNAIGKLAANSGVDIGDVDVTSISAGSNLIGDVGLSGARTSGGTTLYKNIDVDESEDQVKGTAGQVYWIHAINLTAAPLYLKFYNATAASVTVGTTVPDLTFPVPANADSDGAGFMLSVPNGIAFSTAITIAGTTGVADNDSGAPGANELIVNLGYA